MPKWLGEINENSEFDISNVLNDSIYYPASQMDGSIFEGLGGIGHSFVYVDPNVKQATLKERLKLVAGYHLILSREIAKEQLCSRPFNPVLPIPMVDEDPKQIMLCDDFKPYAHWAVFQRKEKTDPVHGPERFSLLFIAGEGVATYQAIYFSNRARPMGIVFRNASAFSGNWTKFERQNGIFERTVMANPAGYPNFLFVDNVYDNNWSRHERSYWHNYTKLYKAYPRYNLTIYQAEHLFSNEILE
jgi:hypothetical protein